MSHPEEPEPELHRHIVENHFQVRILSMPTENKDAFEFNLAEKFHEGFKLRHFSIDTNWMYAMVVKEGPVKSSF
jgi:hypothetical protein